MFTIFGNKNDRTCQGVNRREFLRIGGLGLLGGLTLPMLLQAKAQAAANAPDTASADAAKAAATGSAPTSGTARDTAANAPRTGTLTKEEESAQMPKAGQANNHSSPALETDSGKASKP